MTQYWPAVRENSLIWARNRTAAHIKKLHPVEFSVALMGTVNDVRLLSQPWSDVMRNSSGIAHILSTNIKTNMYYMRFSGLLQSSKRMTVHIETVHPVEFSVALMGTINDVRLLSQPWGDMMQNSSCIAHVLSINIKTNVYYIRFSELLQSRKQQLFTPNHAGN